MKTSKKERASVLVLAMVFVSALAAFAASVLYEGYTKSRAVELSGQTAQNHPFEAYINFDVFRKLFETATPTPAAIGG